MKQLKQWFANHFSRTEAQNCEMTQARQLLRAIDAGGVALNTIKINDIARRIGLEVSRKARPEDTVERIRQAVKRSESI